MGTHLPVEEQNYDPMIPYLAPFMEEAKFQMQEEQELLRFHPWDRRLYSGPTTGLGGGEIPDAGRAGIVAFPSMGSTPLQRPHHRPWRDVSKLGIQLLVRCRCAVGGRAPVFKWLVLAELVAVLVA